MLAFSVLCSFLSPFLVRCARIVITLLILLRSLAVYQSQISYFARNEIYVLEYWN